MCKCNCGRFAILCIYLLCSVISKAQFFDSLEVRTGFESRFSTEKYQPLWLIANRHGTVADRQTDLAPFIRVYNKHVIGEREVQNDRGFYDYDDITLSYGLNVYNNNHFRSTMIEEGYAKLDYKNWSFRGGRFEEDIEDIDPLLSSGSLGVSSNALPIPKIGIAVTNYTNVPFTNGWLQFKGTFAHGWLGKDRYIRNSFYHEKTFFLRAGPGRLKFYGGIQHFVEWGGERGDQKFDNSLKGFVNAFFAKETGEGGGTINRSGDQRGVLDAGLYWENDNLSLHSYIQKPFEGRHDLGFGNKNLMAGFIVSMKDRERGLQKILVELISTKGINENVTATQRESYYNNNIYKTGWEYKNNIIGTPLFMNRTRASKYFPDIQPFKWTIEDADVPANANIINNRILGVHTAASYSITDMFYGRTLLTYTKNYGTIQESSSFATNKNQFYGLQEISYWIADKSLTITAGIGFDHGDFSKAVGGLLGIEWNIPFRKNTSDVY
ncbi:MAG: capsule assembly Wzi family protein [Chitinophagaceae bacterium]